MKIDNALGSFFGLAIGDAFGNSLEFIHGPRVRYAEVHPKTPWTDDTHMSLYLAEALLEWKAAKWGSLVSSTSSPERDASENALGHAIGRQFAAWRTDPLTPSTAPGGTCLAGAGNYAASKDWRTSGMKDRAGCGAVMRVVPVAIYGGWNNAERRVAARLSSLVTHAHPNALDAAQLTVALIRIAGDRGYFSAELVRQVQAESKLDAACTAMKALDAAIHWAESADPDTAWLDERCIPDGDGGWRAPSCLGLAVASALRFGVEVTDGGNDSAVTPDSFLLAINKATRIDGDSDSVGAVCGAILGAAGGVSVLPEAWNHAIRERQRIAALVEALHGGEA